MKATKKKPASETISYTLTEAQIRALRGLSETEFQFPGRGMTRPCEALERMKLAHGELHLSKWNALKGVSTFSRAYRLTHEGVRLKKAFKGNP